MIVSLAAVAASAAVKLPAFFSDHAVLLRSKSTAIFGRAAANEKITVTLGKVQASTVAAKNGKWRVNLDLSKCPEGPFDLKINDKVIKDVVVGEVWLCSGQSNMEFRLARCHNFQDERFNPAGSRLRYFKVTRRLSPVPLIEVSGKWVKADLRYAGIFTGVGYFFGKKLLNTLNTPVGLIDSSWGGSPIESWMSTEDAAASSPGTIKHNQEVTKIYHEFPAKLAQALTDWNAWEKKYGRTDTEKPAVIPDAKQHKEFTDRELSKLYGAIWFCNELDVPAKRAGNRIPFLIKTPGPVALYCNGKFVASYSLKQFMARENFINTIPGKLVKPGKNLIQLRFFTPLLPVLKQFKNQMNFGAFAFRTPWKVFVERPLPAPTREMLKNAPAMPPMTYEIRLLARAYNGMIFPLAPYSLSGVIWYQGEANASRAKLYSELFPAMISGWRKLFEKSDLPFYYCQIAPYYSKTPNPNSSATWAELREAQEAALKLPRTGQAVLLDVGEARDIHPRNKKTPGERLAAVVLEDIYGKKSADCVKSPRFLKAVREGNAVRVYFSNTGKGLKAAKLPETHIVISLKNQHDKLVRNSPDSEVEGFAVQDKAGKWHWANAVIKGDSVLVSCAKAAEIKAVRYAWANNPTCNLVNSNDLPASSFQTQL